ncbi:hypothetical protein [Pedococcus soli]
MNMTSIGTAVGRIALDVASDIIRAVLGSAARAVVDRLMSQVGRLVDRAVQFLLERRGDIKNKAADTAESMTESVVDALVEALGRAQAELVRLRSTLTVDDALAVFSRQLAPTALHA